MTVEEHFEKMQKECDRLSNVGKKNMLAQLLLNEAREAYEKLDDRKKANIFVDSNTGLLATSGDPDKAIAAALGACGIGTK